MKWVFVLVLSVYVCLSAEAIQYELFEIKGKVGLKDESGKIILPATFEGLGWSDGSFSIIGQTTGYKLNNQWGLINLNKEFITQALYENLEHWGGYLLVARKKVNAIDYKTGCIDLRGEVAIPFVYDGIKISALQAIVFNKVGSTFKYGLVSLKNEIVIPLEYAFIFPLGASRYAVENSKGQTSIFSDQGNPTTLFSIDSISTYQYNYAVFYQGFHQGLIDRDGNIVVESIYQKIKIKEDGSLHGQLPSECQILSGDNKILNKIEADGLTSSCGKSFKIKRGKLFGLLDDQLNTIFAPQYDVLAEIGNTRFMAKKKSYGIIRSDNSIVLPFEFDSLIVSNGLVRAKEKSTTKNVWALYDTLGKRRTASAYEWIGESTDNYSPVRKRGYWGVIDTQGKEIIPCVYDSIVNTIGGQFTVKLRGEYGVINSQEDWLMAPQPFAIRLLRENRILMTQAKINYVKDLSGNIIYFSEFPLACNSEFMCEKLPNGIERRIDYYGRLITASLPLKVERVETIFEESEGLRGIKKDGKYGFIDKKGNLRIANRYDAISQFKESLVAVKLNGKWGYINTDEKIVIQPSYEQASDFNQGKALVKRNALCGLIDKEGKEILAIRYDSIQPLVEGHYLLTANNLKGLADNEGRVIIEPKFDELVNLGNGYLMAKRDGKFGLITSEGLSTIPLIYENLIYNNKENNYMAMKVAEWQTIVPTKN